jgi:transposase
MMVSELIGDRAGRLELQAQRLGALPIVCHFVERMRLGVLLERYLPASDARVALAPARAIGLVVRNLCVSHVPLYRLGEWAAAFDPNLLGVPAGELSLLNDDRVGRALERLFEADRASFLTELMLGVIAEFEIDCSQLHNDSTSVTLHGAYPRADGRAHAGKATVALARGHSKDYRPDLKQLIWILTVCADEALPVAYRLADGNTNDESTHIATWDGLRALTGRSDFLYVADCKLATRSQMAHIDDHGGRFVTKLPRPRNEHRLLSDWTRQQQPQWTEADRQPPIRKKDPDQVWNTAPAPIRSVEGHRIVWVHDTNQQRLDEHIRRGHLTRAQTALTALNQRLHGPRCRFADPHSVQAALDSALTKHGCAQLLRVEILDRPAERVSAQTRGPDNTIHRHKTLRPRYTLRWEIDQQALAHDTAADGCYALITNDHKLTDAQILAAYRYQPNIEKRHHQLKTIQHAAPVYLNNTARIEALFLCHYIALLCRCLIERQLRQTMTRQQITELPLYPEHRACQHPTATRTLELFAQLTRHHLTHNHHQIQTFPPQLDPLQTRLLDLLDVPPTPYTQ